MMNPLLQIENLHLSWKGPQKIIVRDISFSLYDGEGLAIVGETGSGKTTLIRSIVLSESYDGPKVVEGKILFKNLDITCLSEKQRRRFLAKEIGFIGQSAYQAFDPLFTIGFQIKEVYKTKGINEEIQDKMLTVGLSPDVVECYPHQLSGGMLTRVQIAIALIGNPSLILADEPFSGLDVINQRHILELFGNLMKNHKKNVMFTTHNLGTAKIADNILVMFGGMMVEYGRQYDVLTRPLHPYTASLISARPLRGGSKRDTVEGKCPYLLRCDRVQGRCKRELPTLARIEQDRFVRCFYPMVF